MRHFSTPIIAMLTAATSLFAQESPDYEKYDIHFNLSLQQAVGDEANRVDHLVPLPSYHSPSTEEWREDTVNQLEALIALVKSGNYEDGNVDFGTTTEQLTELMTENLNYQTISFSGVCIDCKELQALNIPQEEKQSSYEEFSKRTINAIHNLEMLLLKDKFISFGSIDFENDAKTHIDESNLKRLSINFKVGCMLSEEFRAFSHAVNAMNSPHESRDEWLQASINTMHRLIELIHSGNITLANSKIELTNYLDN